MSERDGLVWAYQVGLGGHGTQIEWDGLESPAENGFQWIHLDRSAQESQTWLREKSGLGDLELDALLAEETRPRATPMGNGLLVILRGVNLSPGADPEDMVSVRMWVDSDRVITLRRQRLLALTDVREQIDAGNAPTSSGDFVAAVAERLVERMGGVLNDLDENLDAIEEGLETASATTSRSKLLALRRQAITLRRHLSPQREALTRLSLERMAWLGDRERQHLRETLDRTTRYIEDLESARERAAVTQEELANRLAEQMNRRMYALSIIAGIFLPLSFATGLLGINVGGIPGAETSWAFAAFCGILSLIAVGEILLFRRLKWL